jgi:hypothetical protein
MPDSRQCDYLVRRDKMRMSNVAAHLEYLKSCAHVANELLNVALTHGSGTRLQRTSPIAYWTQLANLHTVGLQLNRPLKCSFA